MRDMLLLLTAAVLEVAGDALIRGGLKTGGLLLMCGGAAILVVYGFLINLTRLDFGHLMGMYIVVFFLVAQVTSIVFFGERPSSSLLVGGALILAGGLVMTLWRPS